MLRLVRDVFPKLVETDGLDVVVKPDEDVPEYAEEEAAPVVSFASAAEDTTGPPGLVRPVGAGHGRW